MEHRCIFAGFGGQGVISMGMLLAYAAVVADKNSTFFPAYGIAMRGGTANCTVLVSDSEIASPISTQPNVMVVMNDVSFDHFQPCIAPGGLFMVNSSLVNKKATRTDVRTIYVPASGIAIDNGDVRMANVVMLGAVLKATGMLPLEPAFKAMAKVFPPKLQKLIGKNQEVMQLGYNAV